MNKIAVHFGAGSIGRGFLGQLYFESGYNTVFIDVMADVVAALNARGAYPVEIVSESGNQRIEVKNVSAVDGRDKEHAAQTLARAAVASTAVGLNALPYIAPVIARAIELRFADATALPLDIMLCENVKNGEAYMRGLVREHLAPEYQMFIDKKVGFIEASIGRMVPVMTPEQRAIDPLLVCVEPYCELPVDAAGFKGIIPPINHLKPTDNFVAYVERKLFVHNLTHATTAYLGYRKGYSYIYEAIRDEEIRRMVEGAGKESCTALAKKRGLDAGELAAHVDDLIFRYHNTALADQIARVARDPLRKLGRDDRLIGAARLCVEQGVEPKHIAIATAAAILYDADDDPTVPKVREILQRGGVGAVLSEISNIEPDKQPGLMIVDACHKLQKNKG